MQITQFIIASFFVISLPGQDVMYLISQSISNSKKAGLITAMGLAFGNIVHTAAIAFGIAYVLSKSPEAIFVIKFTGAIYLLYLALCYYKDRSLIAVNEIDSKAAKKIFLQGIAMNVLNAKAWLFAVLFFPNFLDKNSTTPVADVFTLGIIFVIMAWIIFSAFAVLASMLATKLINSEKSANIIRYIKTSIMLIIAIYLFI